MEVTDLLSDGGLCFGVVRLVVDVRDLHGGHGCIDDGGRQVHLRSLEGFVACTLPRQDLAAKVPSLLARSGRGGTESDWGSDGSAAPQSCSSLIAGSHGIAVFVQKVTVVDCCRWSSASIGG